MIRVLSKALLSALLATAVTAAAPATRADQAAAPSVRTGLEQTAALSPDDIAAVRRAIDYLNGIESFEARFLQVSSDGGIAEGDVVVDRPGKLRFDYDPPVPVLIIANG
ncbi:MAG TPA: outer membrane lipoprotein carrier protein LolA, partial [Kiloniellales bacterium]|nr:outer membrane lipoprotein carrier protein LolA [Kiloniellales bacterium]